ncbi:S-methyl-5'-thioadenosine phosphorylase [bacterium]|nr:S-methyl-5'-thioadenosine phosphorylase [bacterium]
MGEGIGLAVIGGSGFYDMPGLEDAVDVRVATPFGDPSDAIRVGKIGGVPVAFLARHGRHHSLLPSELPQRANFWALKSLGVKRVVAVSAVGSLREEYAPGDCVIPDQLIDRTRGARPATFFGDGIVAHVSMAEPFCPALSESAQAAAIAVGAACHRGGSYVVIEGPAFGTRAESELYRSWGIGVVGMTALPEAKLAREAELCYSIISTVTDYDSWRADHRAVDAATIFRVLRANVAMGQSIVATLAGTLGPADCSCHHSLDAALVTSAAAIPPATRTRLEPILARRLATEEAPV